MQGRGEGASPRPLAEKYELRHRYYAFARVSSPLPRGRPGPSRFSRTRGDGPERRTGDHHRRRPRPRARRRGGPAGRRPDPLLATARTPAGRSPAEAAAAASPRLDADFAVPAGSAARLNLDVAIVDNLHLRPRRRRRHRAQRLPSRSSPRVRRRPVKLELRGERPGVLDSIDLALRDAEQREGRADLRGRSEPGPQVPDRDRLPRSPEEPRPSAPNNSDVAFVRVSDEKLQGPPDRRPPAAWDFRFLKNAMRRRSASAAAIRNKDQPDYRPRSQSCTPPAGEDGSGNPPCRRRIGQGAGRISAS